jgi:hypothetical protein
MAQSWEFYQQTETGNTFTLWWICGKANSGGGNGQASTALLANTVYEIPFDQMRAVTASKIMIYLTQAGPANSACRLGIYKNDSNTNNVPNTKVVDAGELVIDGTATLGVQTKAINTDLSADTRYWVVLWTNANAGGSIIHLTPGAVFFWGAIDGGQGSPTFIAPMFIELTGQQYPNAVPNSFPSVTNSNLVKDNSNCPPIALAFSSVT